jgi:hypothetical protein
VNASIRLPVVVSLAHRSFRPLALAATLAVAALGGTGCAARGPESPGAWQPRTYRDDRFVAANPFASERALDIASGGAVAHPNVTERVSTWWPRERQSEHAPIARPSPRPSRR